MAWVGFDEKSKRGVNYSLALELAIKVSINYNLGITLLSKGMGQKCGYLHLREIFLLRTRCLVLTEADPVR